MSDNNFTFDADSLIYLFNYGGYKMNTVKRTSIEHNDISKFFASEALREQALETKQEDFINFAYTDYGGTYFDKVIIEYFIKKHPGSIVWENTSYSGKNAFIFSSADFDLNEFIEVTENYPLGWNNLEDFYYGMEYTEKEKGFNDFLNWEINNDYNIISLEGLKESFEIYTSVLTSGCDYSTSSIIEEAIEQGYISKIEEE